MFCVAAVELSLSKQSTDVLWCMGYVLGRGEKCETSEKREGGRKKKKGWGKGAVSLEEALACELGKKEEKKKKNTR